jgi:DNA-binding winged helix-turn-helix (wHTH) protein
LFGSFSVHVASLQLFHAGQPVALTPKVFDALLVLLQHRHRVVGKDELMRLVWRDAFVSEDSLSQCVSALRRALGDDPNHPVYVATIPRRGYRFIAPVTVSGGGRSTSPADAHPAPASRLHVPAGWVAIAVAVAATLIAAVALSRTDPAPAATAPVRLTMQPATGTSFASGVLLSPDGRSAAFVAEDDRTGVHQLWVRSLSDAEPRLVAGSEGASKPFWSPTGDAIGFFADGSLKTVRLAAGPPQTLATVGLSPAGGSWGSSGVILFAGWRSPVYAVSENGGPARAVTTLDPGAGERGHQWPQFLPDGRRFFYVVGAANKDRAARGLPRSTLRTRRG